MGTARKWLERYDQVGPSGLLELSSRTLQPGSTINEDLARIGLLRCACMPMRRFAILVGCSVATISHLLAPPGAVQTECTGATRADTALREERAGEPLHKDT